MCRKAADSAFLRSIDSDISHPIDQVTMLEIIKQVKPSVDSKQLMRFQKYRMGAE